MPLRPGSEDGTVASVASMRLKATVPELVERAGALARPGRRTVLGITGAPGAGKSTLTSALQAALADVTASVPMDGFHLSNEVLEDLGRRERKGARDTFDVAGFVALLHRLRAQDDEVVYAPAFDRSVETAVAGAIPVHRAVPLIITEGNYLLHDTDGWERVRSLLDEVWFIDVDATERVDRLVRRRTADGESVAEAEAWVQTVDMTNAGVVQRTAQRADLLITLVDEDDQNR